jgi:hypothetical protein
MTLTEQGSSPIRLADILADATQRVIVIVINAPPDPLDLMPNGEPAKGLMTEPEAAKYLRMTGTPKQIKKSMARYVRTDMIIPTIIQKERHYTLAECKSFIVRQTRNKEAGNADRPGTV